MVHRAALLAVAASGATAIVLACSTFSSNDALTTDAGGDAPAPPPGSSSGADAVADDGGALAPIACDAGPPDIAHVATASGSVDHLASDGLYAYWRTGGLLFRARVEDGSVPELLTDEAGPPAPIALTANNVYFLSGGVLEVVPKGGGVAPATVILGNGASTVASNADHAFIGISGGIRSVADGTTTAGDIRVNLANPTAIAVANDTLAYITSEPEASTKNGLYAGSASHFGVDPPLVDDVAGTALLATDGTTVFWANSGDVLGVDRGTLVQTKLLHEAQPIGALLADDEAVVYQTAAGLMLYDRVHGCTARVTSDPTPALALTATDVFFVRKSSEIVRARR